MMNNVTAMAKEKVAGATWEGRLQNLSEKVSLKTSKPTRHTGHDGDGDDNDGDGDNDGNVDDVNYPPCPAENPKQKEK